MSVVLGKDIMRVNSKNAFDVSQLPQPPEGSGFRVNGTKMLDEGLAVNVDLPKSFRERYDGPDTVPHLAQYIAELEFWNITHGEPTVGVNFHFVDDEVIAPVLSEASRN